MKHFVAVLEVYEVEKENRPGERGVDKGKSEVARVVVRGVSLESLKTKLNGHVELLEDDNG